MSLTFMEAMQVTWVTHLSNHVCQLPITICEKNYCWI